MLVKTYGSAVYGVNALTITIDLAGSENVELEHLAESINYRSLDRDGWAG
jgi:predicted ATPase with chaperone activity